MKKFLFSLALLATFTVAQGVAKSYKKAAEAGDVDAQYKLARQYEAKKNTKMLCIGTQSLQRRGIRMLCFVLANAMKMAMG